MTVETYQAGSPQASRIRDLWHMRKPLDPRLVKLLEKALSQ